MAKRRPDLEIPGLESLCVEIVTNASSRFLLVCFYRPPNARASSWDDIDSLFDRCVDSDISNIILLGDINVDLLSISVNHKFSRLCHRLGLENVISEPTGLHLLRPP